jgi:flagellar biosynthesis regulator FlbT
LTEGLKKVLTDIRGSLASITFSMKKCIDDGLEMNLEDMDGLGHRLVLLAECFKAPLKELKHTVLMLTLMDAGLSIRYRVKELKKRGIMMEDTIFFVEVYSFVKLIEDSIASGEYYEELSKIYWRKLNEDPRTHT